MGPTVILIGGRMTLEDGETFDFARRGGIPAQRVGVPCL